MSKTKNKLSEKEQKKAAFSKVAKTVINVPVENFLKDNFLTYAWSATLDRALTDVSGLKPVQRRILYTMYLKNLTPSSHPQKIPGLGGAVLAYHSHGDMSVMEAIKNLGRDYIFRVPLVEGGKGDDYGAPGLPGAQPRYIAARLTKAGWLNVEEIKQKAVPMVLNYDETDVEPLIMPVKWPVAIINGSSGLGVGYAAKIPSHNPTEIMKATLLLLKNPEASIKQIQKIIKGPDFNMGGKIIANDGIKEYLETGAGSFKIRGKYVINSLPRGKHEIVFYEIPFDTNPEMIISKIQTLSAPVGSSKGAKGLFKELSSYKDLNDINNPVKISLEVKAGAQPQKVVNDLFKHTPLETSFSTNLTTIIEDKPVQLGIIPILLAFIEFRKQCIRNKSKFNLSKKEDRLLLVEGLLKVLLDIDAAIKIIRNSKNPAEANVNLQKKFKISETQSSYILKLQLQKLTKMDQIELKNEKDQLLNEISELNEILTNEDKLSEFLQNELLETMQIIKDERKTEILDGSVADFADKEKEQASQIEELNEDKPCFITRFTNGTLIKTIDEPFTYNVKTAKMLKNSPIVETIKTMTNEKIVLVDSGGTGHRIPVSFLAVNKIQTLKQIGVKFSGDLKLVGLAKNELNENETGLAIGTRNGSVKISKTDFPLTMDEFPVISLTENDEIVNCAWIDGKTENTLFSFISSDSSVLVFDANTIRVAGSKAGGVRGMKVKPGAKIISFNWVSSQSTAFILSQTEKTLKMTPLSEIPLKGKGGQGMILQKFNKGETSLINAWTGVNPIITVKNEKKIVQLPMLSKRATAGVPCPFPCDFGSTDNYTSN